MVTSAEFKVVWQFVAFQNSRERKGGRGEERRGEEEERGEEGIVEEREQQGRERKKWNSRLTFIHF